jgi:superfamily I DNA/RNA helicase/mRNA-degrading endonuclease RelE of RelBE toxin-antitoxin system
MVLQHALLGYQIYATDGYLDRLKRLPPHIEQQIVAEVEKELRHRPTPDGHAKKQLKSSRRPVLYRLRSGNYRIIYSYVPSGPEPEVTLHIVGSRGGVYRENISFHGRREVIKPTSANERSHASHTGNWTFDGRSVQFEHEEPDHPLPRMIDDVLLAHVGAPAEAWAALRRCKTEGDLFDLELDEDLSDAIIEELLSNDLFIMPADRRWRADSETAMLRWLEGDRTALYLDMAPEQQRYAVWNPARTGPTLVKGSPGTGKSVVALHWAASLASQLKSQGNPNPSVLIATYTNALVASHRHLAPHVLGDDARFVQISTIDQFVSDFLRSRGLGRFRIDGWELQDRIRYARETLINDGETGREAMARLGSLRDSYLQEEIEQVLVGRDLRSAEDYREASRDGRRVRLTGPQRDAIWMLSDRVEHHLDADRKTTFALQRRDAVRELKAHPALARFDGVVIDEAQDLEPNVIALALGLAGEASRMFVTADADQSIYGGVFRWSIVAKVLGISFDDTTTGTLKTCYRSTREIAAAAADWLSDAGIEPKDDKLSYIRRGALPIAHPCSSWRDAYEVVAKYLITVMHELSATPDCCAVLAPTNSDAKITAEALRSRGVEATFQQSSHVDLAAPGVKVLTYHAAKGLEFPIVAVLDPVLPDLVDEPENPIQAAEVERRERNARARFVAMTRAMFALAYFPIEQPGRRLPTLPAELWRNSDEGWAGFKETLNLVEESAVTE